MGAWVSAGVSLSLLLLVSSLPHTILKLNPVKRDDANSLHTLSEDNPLNSLAKPNQQSIKTFSSNYLPYSIVPYSTEELDHSYSKPLSYNIYSNNYYPIQESDGHGGIAQEFTSIEEDRKNYNEKDFQDHREFLDTTGYKEYGSQTSFNLEGPTQVEEIETKNYHKEVEPYDTYSFKKYHHGEEEDHAEMHYHQHKHLHKHKHKQDHQHKHKEEHKHEHDHHHKHQAQHEHKHKQDHRHHHHNEHKHEHHGHHEHKHKQEHKHEHYHGHNHEHKQKEEHKHKGYHDHKHEEWSDHKHNHHDDHKHEHHHGHKEWNEHKHEHKHQNYHHHKHGQQHGHKHQHYEKNNHYHTRHKHW